MHALAHAFVPLLQQERGEVFAYVVDQVGTAKELLTGDGLVAWSASHGVWGKVVAEHMDARVRARHGTAVRSPFRLLGQIADDELGLCFTRFRSFDPEVGRWVSPDPLGVDGSRNLYAFDGAPSLVVDPWGLTTTSAQGGGHPAPAPAARFIAQPDGTVVDTQATPPGSYTQPNGGRTDILQQDDHGAGQSHTLQSHPQHQPEHRPNVPERPPKGRRG